MYNKIVKIMNKSKEENKDIGVAYDMLRKENPDADLKAAFEFYKKHYFDISKLRQAGRMDLVKQMCDLDESKVCEFLKELEKDGVLA